MPKSGQSEYVVLQDKDAGRKTGVKLITAEDGSLGYSWEFAPAVAPDVEQKDVSYGAFTPDQELVWSQNNWSDGGLKFYYESSFPNKYAIADKVWAMTPHELALGPQPLPITFGMKNGGAEMGDTTDWTPSGVTLTAATTAPYSGIYHFTMTGTSTNDYIGATAIAGTDAVDAIRWRSKFMYVTAKVRGSEAGGAMRVQIIEAGGSSTPTTNGTAATLTTSYQLISSGVTIQSDTTSIVIRIECSADGGSDRTVYVDEIQAMIAASSTEGMNTEGLRMVAMGGNVFAATNRALFQFDETKDYWELVYAAAADITGIEVFDNRIFLGLGESTAYVYSDAGDAKTWTAASGSGNKANYFAKTLNVNGNWAMAKTLNDDDVHLTADPTGTPTYGTAIEVGKDDRAVTNIYNLEGSLAIGKEDGLYRYSYHYGNRFYNVYEGAGAAVDPNNFSRGLNWNGWFYTVFNEVGMMRYNGQTWQDISPYVQSPGFSEMGSRVRAFATDGKSLFVLVEDLAAASITKNMWVFALQERIDGSWTSHQVAKFTMSDATDMFVFKPSGASNQFLFINGEYLTTEPASYRLRLPNKTETPRLAETAALALSGTFVTSYWDGNRPQINKAFNKITLVTENLSSARKITIAYQVDNETSTWTDIHSDTPGTSSVTLSPTATIGFNEGVVGRRIRLRFTFETDSSTASPILKGFALHTSWRPPRLRRWRIVGAIEDDTRNLQGVRYAMTAEAMLTNLRSLAEGVSPILIEDLDAQSHRCHIVNMAEMQHRVRSSTGGQPRYSRSIALDLVEAVGSGWNFGRWGTMRYN